MVTGNPSSAGTATGVAAARRRAALGRVWIAVVLILLEVGMVGLLVAAYQWSGGSSTGLGSAPFVVTAISAAAGIGVLLVILAANLAAARAVPDGRPLAGAAGLATLGQWLALGRLFVLVSSIVLVFFGQGGKAGDLADIGLFCVAVIVALFTVVLAMVTGRGARR